MRSPRCSVGWTCSVFTGGIGTGSHEVRAAVASRLGHLGVHIADEPNRRGDELVSDPGASCTVLSVETDEERVMAAQARRLLDWQPEPESGP